MWKLGLCVGALVACACPNQQGGRPGGGPGGEGSGSATVVLSPGQPASCAAVRDKVAGLYRAEARVKEPKRVEEAVADNTTMVMNDCARSPAKVATCLAAVATVEALEKTCLVPLDPEGTDGDALGGQK